jgi:RNA polymerase sigma factor (sigma-70 family)
LHEAYSKQGALMEAPEADREPVPADLLTCTQGLKIVLLRLTRNRELAGELAQQVLTDVLQAIHQRRIRQVSALPGYVYTAARNAVFTHGRQVRLASNFESQVQDSPLPITPLEYCERQEISGFARQVLQELTSERDRRLIEEFYVAGRSKAELMVAWDIDRNLFDKVLSRARQRMRELLQKKMNEMRTNVSEPSRTGVSAGKETKS